MSVCLLDVSVLLALSWPGHQFHEAAQRWFGRNGSTGWATCPIVEAGFVRIISNPAFSPRAVTAPEALSALAITVAHPAHQFWADGISLADALRFLTEPLQGPKQVTDAYLVGLAIHKGGRLATTDRGISRIAPAGSIELII